MIDVFSQQNASFIILKDDLHVQIKPYARLKTVLLCPRLRDDIRSIHGRKVAAFFYR